VGKPCLVEFFSNSSRPHPLRAVGLPSAPSKSQEHPRRREASRADLLLPTPPSRRPPDERPSPRLCPAPTPSPAGANPTGAPAPCPTGGLAGPPWSWQPGPVPIRPSELSGMPTHEHRRPWDECEAQYCAAVLIFFILIPRNCSKFQKLAETCRNVQKLQHKFCMNPLEPLFTVSLTKLTFMQ
jgi:hypothetical protein